MTDRRPPVPDRVGKYAWLGYLTFATMGTVCYVLAPRAARSGMLFNLLGVSAAVAIIAGVRMHRPERRLPWYLFAAAQLLFVTGDFLYYTLPSLLGGYTVDFPSAGDIPYFSVYPLIIAGILLLIHARNPRRDRAAFIDALIIGIGVGVVSWVYLMVPYARDEHLPLGAKALSIAYPLMDVLVLAVTARLAVDAGRRAPVFFMLVAGLLSLVAADAAYGVIELHGTYSTGSLLDLGWIGYYVAWGAAALHPSMRTLSEPVTDQPQMLSRGRLLMLGAATLVSPVVQGTRLRSPDLAETVLVFASIVLFLLVVLRLRMVVRQYEDAEHRERATRDVLEERAQLLNLAHDAILVRDIAGDHGITYWNAGAEATYGWSAEEALGRVSHELLETEFPRPLSEIAEEMLRTGRWHGELTQRVRDGGRVVVDSRWALHTDAAGHPQGALEVNRDITERTCLERALQESSAELLRASQAKSEFMSRMSHELRTPLNAILGFSQLLETDIEDRHADFLRRIQSAGRHLLDLINDILDISRVESGTMDVSIEPVPIAAVVEETAELIRPLAAARRIALSTELVSVSDQHVLANLQWLKQVLLNLMSNAVKYNREGGRISVVATLHNRAVRVAVADTGPGIPPHERERLFHAFDRLGAEKTGVEGTGLGLMLSRQLLIAMGGSIGVESSDRGATFTVELPAAERQEEPLPGRASIADGPAQSGGRVVLYVEDKLSSLQLVERIFERQRHGLTILPAMQGSLAFELAREHRPDLILLDVHLPDIDGHEVLQRLRAEERTARIPVVLISDGSSSTGRIQEALDAGARACLTRPLDVDRFLAVIDEALGGCPPP